VNELAANATLPGPVSEWLERDVRAWVRKQGVVIWLDADGHYKEFVERLKALRAAGTLPYSVYSFRRSHLQLMLELEQEASGTERPPLLLHLPGFNEDTVRSTPLLELYFAGKRYRIALETLVTDAAEGLVPPDAIEHFKQQPGLTLAAADAWLRSLTAARGTGIAADLQRMTPTAFLDDLRSRGHIAAELEKPENEAAVWDRAAAWLGLPEVWRKTTLHPLASGGTHALASQRADDIAFTVAGWCLAVEYVDDLRGIDPVNTHLQGVRALPRGVIEQCRTVAAHLRERHPDFYRRVADEVETLLQDEVERADPQALGSVDTFRFEEDIILDGALNALSQLKWSLALDWSKARVHDPSGVSFWLRNDVERLAVWQLVHSAATLGQQLERAGLALFTPRQERTLDAAAERYAELGAPVDQAHRYLEQKRVALLVPQLPKFEKLRAQLDQMREHWRTWADAWAREFNALCRLDGFLPSLGLQQRTLFDDVVRPLTQEPGVTAYFVIDAFRFEMGSELFAKLDGGTATTCVLKPRLAELPSVTEVGMNVLAPVQQNGKLALAFSTAEERILGFQCGADFRVQSWETRKRAMHDRVGGTTCPWLELDEVLKRDNVSLKATIAQARLLVVHSDEIDLAGEKGVGLPVFDVVLQKVRSAWALLRDAGVRRFVFTSDHGFLLLEGAREVQAHGRKIDPKGRHVFSKLPTDHTGEVRVALSDLGYGNVPEFVMFPETTAVFDRGNKVKNFVHGGNSLQERVIPVLTVVHRAAAGGNVAAFQVDAKVAEGVMGMHCLEVTVQPMQTTFLDFGGPKEVELGLKVEQAPDVQLELCQTRGKARLESGGILATVGQRFEIFFKLTAPVSGRVQVSVVSRMAQTKLEPYVLESWFDVTQINAPRLPKARTTEGSDQSRAPVDPSDPGTIDDKGNARTTGVTHQAPTAEGKDEPPRSRPLTSSTWVQGLPEGGVREVFLHIDVHRSITETEVAQMLGGQRGARKFTNNLDEYGKRLPFRVQIKVVAGVKHYVKEDN